MENEAGIYVVADKTYFETLQRFKISSNYWDILRTLVPANWIITRFDTWLQASFAEAVHRGQGFKIHVSCRPEDAAIMLQRIVPICVQAHVQFKIIADPALHRLQNGKRFPRSGSGKFATIYPFDQSSFTYLVDALHQATKEMEGPYILSDKRYSTSKVIFYRYGGFERVRELKLDGSYRLMIRTQEGGLTPDERVPYFRLPAGIADPFPDEAKEEDDNGRLHRRYEITAVLNFSNTGGVYQGIDHTTGERVVIKEARPNTITWSKADLAIEATSSTRHEYRCLERFTGLKCVPQVIEIFKEWEHLFLVESFFDGIPLAKLRAQEDFILMTKMHDALGVQRFCCLWRDICLQLLDMIDAIHERGVIIGDVSPNNILVNTETWQMVLIDFEGALLAEASDDLARFGTQWFTPGFRKRDRLQSTRLSLFDDFYACGMVLYNLICPMQNLFELDSSQPLFRILDHFIEAGLPVETKSIIEALLQGNVVSARATAAAWDPAVSMVSI